MYYNGFSYPMEDVQRSREFSSHIHIIFDDRVDIVVMNDEVRRWQDMKGMGRYVYGRRVEK